MKRHLKFFALKKAERYLRHPEELLHVLGQALQKAYNKRTILFDIWNDLMALIRLVKAWVVGDYKDAPKRVILWSVVAILYFLSPLDFIPDIFPGGYLDDIFVIQLILKKFQEDLAHFKNWEKKRASPGAN